MTWYNSWNGKRMVQKSKSVLFHCFSDSYAPASILKAISKLPDCQAVFCNSYYSAQTKSEVESMGSASYEWERALMDFVRNGKRHKMLDSNIRFLDKLPNIHYRLISRQFLRHITVQCGMKSMETLIEYMLHYYYSIVASHDIGTIICGENPHCFGDYILVGLASILDVPCFSMKYVAQAGRSLSTIYDLVHFNHAKSPPGKKGNNLCGDKVVSELIRGVTEGQIGSKPPYASSVLSSYESELSSGRASLKARSSDHFLHETIINDIASRKRLVRKNCYNAHAFDKVLLFCLHFEYESSTCPDAGEEYDQQLFGFRLAELAQKMGYTVLIREHPDQMRAYPGDFSYTQHCYNNAFTTSRPEFFYQSLLKLPCVAGFSDPAESVSNILETTRGEVVIASLTGTVLLEAACRGIPAISASSHYLHAAGITYSLGELSDIEFPLHLPLEAKQIPKDGLGSGIKDLLLPWLFRSDFITDPGTTEYDDAYSCLTSHILSISQS